MKNLILFLIIILCSSCSSSKIGNDAENDFAEIIDAGYEKAEWELPPSSLSIGDESSFHIRILKEPFKIEVRNGNLVVASSKSPPFYTGVVEEVLEDGYYDPYEPFYPVQWIAFKRMVKYRKINYAHQIYVESEDGIKKAFFEISEIEKGRFKLKLKIENPENDVNLRISFHAPEGENYYGLGEIFESVAQRGYRRAMQFELTLIESSNNEAHFPIPFFISTKGWGLFVENRRAGSFDMAKEDKNSVLVDFETSELNFYIFIDKRPIDILRHYVEITGKPALPPKWAFAPMFWRNENKDQNEVIEDAIKIRENDIPASTIWIDNPWQSAYNSFVFDPKRFPDPPDMIKKLNELGFRVGVWSTPYLEEKTGDLYQTALKNNYFVKVPSEGWFEEFGKLVDLTNPSAENFWKELIYRATSIGIEGFKLDYGEDVQIGIFGKIFNFSFFNGGNSKNMHHWFNYFYHKPYFEMIGNEKGWLLVRGGTYGDQSVTPIVWPGDLCNGFQKYGENGHVGGLPSAINGGLTLSVSGYPFYGSDTGGFRHGRPKKQAMIRWSQYSAFGTIMQVGGGGENHNPWDFTTYGESQFDKETLDIFRVFAKIHTALFPYIYTYARFSHDSGRCITCPFGFIFPEDGIHPDTEFILGDFILVAPIADDSFEKEVHFPVGRWFDYFNDEHIDGPTSIKRNVPLSIIPVYIKEGAIIPMLSEDVDTLAPSGKKEINSFVNIPQDLIIKIFPSNFSEWTMFDGTKIVCQKNKPHISIEKKGIFKSFILEVHLKNNKAGFTKPANVLDNKGEIKKVSNYQEILSCERCFYFLEEKEFLYIKLPLYDVEIEFKF